MTVKEVADKINRRPVSVYKMIKEKRGIGRFFVYEAGKGWNIDGRKVRAVTND